MSAFYLPAPTPAPTAPSGQCYLPVLFWSGNAASGVSARFFEYPGGAMGGSTTAIKPPASPFYFSGATYDRVAGRWLPVPADAISPDGWSVVYVDYDLPPPPTSGMFNSGSPKAAGGLATEGQIHVVDLHTGADRILFQGSPTYEVVGFTSAGIYLAEVGITMDGEFSSGLYLLDTAGGTPRAVPGGSHSTDRSGWAVVGGAAWSTDYSSGGGLQPGNQLVRLDLKTGAVQVWSTQPEGVAASLIGLDSSGDPLMLTYSSGYSSTGSPPPDVPVEVSVMSAPGTGKVVYRNTQPGASLPAGPSFNDSNGLWLSGAPAGEVWLDSTQSGFGTVAVPTGGLNVSAGGTCA